MNVSQDPLTAAEEAELRQLLAESGAEPLEFARGVFQAAASSPSSLMPPDWLGLVLGDQSSNTATLKRTFSLLMRDYNACLECLALGVPVVPAPEDERAVTQFCRGFVRLTQKDSQWAGQIQALELTLPFAALAGFLEPEKVQRLGQNEREEASAWLARQREELAESVARVFAFFTEARRQKPVVQAAEKVGRNDLCPCSSGKKYKKCCGNN